ncbi:NADH-ubiquinone oxidoreductase 14.8 kDa subunit [Smittium mucronatum]|uniref:NADH-ubiquinone oxidoreductase 14.8 kDa subunit n=1 Tax=Smittium mucronatum TaxID=133383 RepID=A0A1R0GTW4_9FUNG|nr:NADH-ubiquinone oxidoreductase 14.8 kDa subunit [Smittium mucronatum]
MPYVEPIITTFSKSRDLTRQRAIHLYRRWQKAVPTIMEEYRLNFPTAVVRTRIRLEFEKFRNLHDIPAINIALFKGNAEFDETVNCWKQQNHILNYFNEDVEDRGEAGFRLSPVQQHLVDAPNAPISSEFIGKFLSGQN